MCALQAAEDAISLKAYPKGFWFGPCWYAEIVCFQRLDAGMKGGTWNMDGIVGAHRFSGSWN